MRYLAVVVGQPKLRLLEHFGQVPEDMHVDNTTPEASVEALDEDVLHGPPGLDEVELDAFEFCPLCERQGDEFRAIVRADTERGIGGGGLPRLLIMSHLRVAALEKDLLANRFDRGDYLSDVGW